MKLNCKPGDLAVICRAHQSSSLLGMFVTVLRPTFHGDVVSGFRVLNPRGVPVWVVSASSSIVWGDGILVLERPIPDDRLRPIRDNPGEDETLSWIDVPSGVTA